MRIHVRSEPKHSNLVVTNWQALVPAEEPSCPALSAPHSKSQHMLACHLKSRRQGYHQSCVLKLLVNSS